MRTYYDLTEPLENICNRLINGEVNVPFHRTPSEELEKGDPAIQELVNLIDELKQALKGE